MIKGWRKNPMWVSVRESRAEMKEAIKQQRRAAEAQEEGLRVQKQMRDENARHNAECHARKVAAGEIEATQASH